VENVWCRQVLGRWWSSKALWFGLVMFASSAMNSLFVTYYLDLYMNVVQLEAHAFYCGQVIFMIWNATNDPVIGWISDRAKLYQEGHNDPVARRLAVIWWCGIFWAIAFCVVWTPPLEASASWCGAYFAFALCFYDGMLTAVEVNHSALLADISTDDAERATMNAYSGIFAGAGSLTSLIGHTYWSRSSQTIGNFQAVMVLVAVLSAFAIHMACRGLRKAYYEMRHSSLESYSRASRDDTPAGCIACGTTPSTVSVDPIRKDGLYENRRRRQEEEEEEDNRFHVMISFIRQLTQQRNFWSFQLLYFIQVFDCTFEKNHFSIFLDGLVGEILPASILGAIVSASFLLPWIGMILLTPLIQEHGLYFVVRGILLARLVWCVLSAAIGSSSASPFFATWFLLTNRVMSEAVCRVCPLIITDLVDEDKFLHNRKTSVSATIVGASTFMGKLSQSFAPMLGFYVLQADDTKTKPSGFVDLSQRPQLYLLLILVPLICVSLQNCVWAMYSLHGSYLKKVKDRGGSRVNIV